MPNTYTQIHIQFVFAVKFREAVIQDQWKENLHRYITTIIQDNGHKMLQINSMPDHLHLLTGHRPKQSISSLVQKVKSESTKWINHEKFCPINFRWQDGFGAFSYSKSHVKRVIRYIQRQEEHHKNQCFLDEYCKLLNAFDIDFDERYLFHPLQ